MTTEHQVEQTIDPSWRSFLDVAPDSHFPIQNLPYGVFAPRHGGPPHVGVAIGEWVLDLSLLEAQGFLGGTAAFGGGRVFGQSSLNAFLALGRPAWSEARSRLALLVSGRDPSLRDDPTRLGHVLHRLDEVALSLPAVIGDYTDFCASREHVVYVAGILCGDEDRTSAGWGYLPVACHGRSGSIVVSGTAVRRPMGQSIQAGADAHVFGASRQLDFALETGVLVGPGNTPGEGIPVHAARDHLFGMVLVNAWNARDVQGWEDRPFGASPGRNVPTSVSPWVVTLDALAPFKVPGPPQEPEPLAYLHSVGDRGYDVHLEGWLQGDRMTAPERLCACNVRDVYWDVAQQVAHHTLNGCPVRPGDLLASGPISGPAPGARGSLLELTRRGREPVRLAGGETRTFLEDGDRVTMTGWCQGAGFRVGFGELTGRVLPARPPS